MDKLLPASYKFSTFAVRTRRKKKKKKKLKKTGGESAPPTRRRTQRFKNWGFKNNFGHLCLNSSALEKYIVWLFMWPLYLLLNKLLKPEEENAQRSDGDHLTVVDAYSFRQSLSNEKRIDAVLPQSDSVDVPLINQQRTWDCGLACILMVLRTLGIDSCNIQELGELCCTTSIWTVDLAYLLQKFSVSFSYFTVTLGANPKFSVEKFYKEQLPDDLVRVDKLFQKALEAGINIQCRSISGEEISLLILSGKYIAIALVDQYKLSHSWLEDVCVPGFCSGSSGYTGHYVVICGYDAVTDEFEIRDPASSRKHEKVASKRLEEARKSFGTDEDLLLVSLEKNGENQNSPLLQFPT